MTTTTTISESTKFDVKDAFNNPLREGDKITGNFIFSVDLETMEEVKDYWNTLDGSKSLLNAFMNIVRS